MKRAIEFLLLFQSVTLVLAACGPTSRDVEEGPDLFDPERVVDIAIELAPADWDLIRKQERSILDIFGVGCLEGPFPDPFTYVPADVRIDGEAFVQVGLRKKGFLGSLDQKKPSLKIKLDEYVAGQAYWGHSRLTLNNNKQDPSQLHQCLGYDLFRAAGVPAPRCNFARVTVNRVYLGLYSNVESVKKPFLRRYFDDDEGQLYEGTLSDFRAGWTATFEKKTNKTDPFGPDIDALTAALTAPDEELIAAVEPLVDLDAFYTFWAMEVLVSHWDGYANNTNNFFAYHDPGSDRFHFIPWGIDNILNQGEEHPAVTSVFATGELSRRLYLHPESQAAYIARLTELLDTIWDESALQIELHRMQALISPHVLRDIDAGIEAVRDFITTRRQQITSELEDGPVDWPWPPREDFCFEQLGELEVTFSTSWGSLNQADPFQAGSGTITGMVGDWPVETLAVGAVSGIEVDEQGQENAVVMTIALLPDDTLAFVYLAIPSDQYAAGTREVDWSNAIAALFHYDPATDQSQMIAMFGGGSVTLDQAGARNGDPVLGRISGPLVTFPF